MKLFLMAPTEGGPYLPKQGAEVEALLRNFYRPILLKGKVTEESIQDALTSAGDERIHGFWFTGHASQDGLMLSDGNILPPNALAQYLSAAGVEWSMINSCESAALVERLQASYPHDVYANITTITDTAAWRTALLAARALADTGDIQTAYRTAAPAGATPLRYFPSPEGVMSMSRQESSQLDELAGQIRELTHVLIGDDRFGQQGLITHVQQLERQMTSLLYEQERKRLWLLANSVLIILVLAVELWFRS